MVEKIIVSPESIRGVGNIVVPKTGADFEEYNCALEVGEDTVNGEDVTVYVLTPETTIISLVLSSSVGSCGIGDSVVLSVTVTEDSVPVSGQSVSFKLGGTEIGTGTTNSSGVATYTYTATDVGSLNFISVYAGHSSNSVSVVVRHEYSIAFSQSSYVATGGSATLEMTLTDNSVPVEGATVSVSGSDGSLYTGITNSSGIATVTVTVNSDTTFTASYQGASATCTVTVQSYLLYDDASADNQSTLFGSSIALRNGGSNTTSWDRTGYYKITNIGSQKESMRVLAPLTGVTDDFVIEYDSYVEQVSGSSGFVIYNSSTAWEKLTDDADIQKKYWYGYNNGSFHETEFYGNTATYQKWVHYKYTVQGTTFKMEVTYNGSTVVTRTETIHFNRSSSTQYGLDCEWQSNTKTRYKNIVAYTIPNEQPLFYDSGVSGTKNSDFLCTKSSSQYTITTDENYTVFLAQGSDGFYIPNIDISEYENLEITWIYAYGTKYACHLSLLNSSKTSSNSQRWHNGGTSAPTATWYTPSGTKTMSTALAVGDVMKLVKQANTFSLYCNDELISTTTPTYTVCYIGLTSADNNRPFGYKELKVEAL